MNTASIRFTMEDIASFSAASHDRNPLHVSEVYARATPYGEPVVFGILGALAALSRLPDRNDLILREVSLEFRNPLVVGVDYAVQVDERASLQSSVKIYDADRLMMKARFTFQAGDGRSARVAASEPSHPIEEAVDRKRSDFEVGLRLAGVYGVSTQDFAKVVERWGLSAKGAQGMQIAAMMWTSFMVGMELPGKRAIYWRLVLEFRNDHGQPDEGPLRYDVKIEEFDERLELLHTAGDLSVGVKPYGTAHMWAFARRDSPQSSVEKLSSLLPSSNQLHGKVALVVGGSRGLGAAISQALALQGCSVFASYHRCETEAEQIRTRLGDRSGLLELVQGDAAEPHWCRELRDRIYKKYQGLDFLICNASPPIHPLHFVPEKLEGFQEFVAQSLTLVSSPMSSFLDCLSERSGWNVVVSSAFVRDLPAEWPHYVTAKSAVEGLARWTAANNKRIHTLVVRPPKLLTDQTNTTLGRQGAMGVEQVAAAIVTQLCNPEPSQSVVVMESF
jgi:NAD(P)-dependent dehydrogenase (short-subunit alcohol dehydrogenase family)/acyl dehydratase